MHHVRTILLALLALACLPACDWDTSGRPPEPMPEPLEILGVDVTPEPLHPGETATFQLRASRRAGQVTWTFSDGSFDLNSSMTTWIAPPQPGVYRHRVSAYESLVTLDTYSFDVEVVAP